MSKASFSPPVNEVQEAILMAGFSYQAYQFISGPDMILPSETHHLHSFYTPNHEYVASILETQDVGREKAYILLFRGTETSILHPIDTVKDIQVDLNMVQSPFASGEANSKVHRGYKELYQSLFTRHLLQADESIVEVMNTLDSKRPLYITGHSLGGALATLAAMDVIQNTSFQNIKVYTFASPRVGNASFVSAYNRLIPHTVRVVNANDYVPLEPQVQVPFQEPLYYYHVKGKLSSDFNSQSVIHNHSITHYFYSLAEQEPSFYGELCGAYPGFCPPKNPPESPISKSLASANTVTPQPQSDASSQVESHLPTPSLPTTATPPTPVTTAPMPASSPSRTTTPSTPIPATPSPTSSPPTTLTPSTPIPPTPAPEQYEQIPAETQVQVQPNGERKPGISTKYPTIFIKTLRVPRRPNKIKVNRR